MPRGSRQDSPYLQPAPTDGSPNGIEPHPPSGPGSAWSVILPAKLTDFPTLTTCVISARLTPLVPVRPQPSKATSKFPSAREITAPIRPRHRHRRGSISNGGRFRIVSHPGTRTFFCSSTKRPSAPASRAAQLHLRHMNRVTNYLKSESSGPSNTPRETPTSPATGPSAK